MASGRDLPIGRIAEMVGIGDSNYFVKVFKAATGYTPLRYKKLLQRSISTTEPEILIREEQPDLLFSTKMEEDADEYNL